MSIIGKNILEARLKANLTQEELAKRVGYQTKSAINKIEKGVCDVRRSTIMAIAEALNTTPAALMGWEEKEEAATPSIDFSVFPDDVAAVLRMCLDDPALAGILLQIARQIRSGASAPRP